MTIEIHPYRANWPEEFRRIAVALRNALGERALRIDHIGSTAVPGLAAKDVIDLQITVAALDEPVRCALTGLGYTWREAVQCDHCPPHLAAVEDDWRKWFFQPPPGQRRTNTHVRVAGKPNQCYPLLFRDYLRAHPASAQAYAELKRRLALNLADAETYADVKDPAVDLIYLAAKDWAAATKWQLAASDA
jgi:GrpB-like predicted nucleotidyltransferase (UPF0157 family)